MAEIKGKLIIHGVGGAGINISADILDALYDSNDIAELEYYTMDSTDKTIQRHEELMDNFYRITLEKRRNQGLDGSGGERKNKELVKHYQTAVKGYMDEFGFANPKVNEFHLVIFSGSGGTGSVAGVLLYQELLQTGNVVIPVVVGDASNMLFITNTINTLNSLENITRKNKSASPVVFYSNTENGITNRETEEKVNKKVINVTYILASMLGGEIQNIDLQDMRNFLRPSNYKTINVQPGIYELAIKRKILDVEDAIIARTITAENVEEDINVTVPLLSNKVGNILSEEIYNAFKEDLPMYVFLRTNSIFETIDELEKEYERLEQETKKKRRQLRTNVVNEEDDDTGLCL